MTGTRKRVPLIWKITVDVVHAVSPLSPFQFRGCRPEKDRLIPK